MAYDGIPAGLRFQLNTSGSTFTDISDTIPRQSVQFSRGKPGEPGTVTFECLPNGAGWNIAEWQELRIDDVTDPGSAYPRLGVYYIMDFDAGKDGAEKTYNVTAYDQNILLTRGPNQILGEIIVGARPYRTATTAYIVGDVVEPTKAKLWAASTAYALNALIEPTTANRHYYKCTTAGTTGGSEPVWTQVSGGTTTSGTAVFTEQGTTENGHIYRCTVAGTTGATVPTFPTGTGATVADGTVTWTEFGAVTHTDKQAVEYLVNNYLPECGTAVNQVIGSLTAIALEDESLASALAKIALQASPSFYDGWEALKPYVAGNIILASPDNGYYYECTTAGTSGSSVPGVWGTALGDTVSSGSAVFTNRGSSTTMPFALVTVDPDNAGHTAAWTKKVGWYDANSETQVPTLTIEYSDQVSEDATHYHYEPATKRKRDAQALRNRQTVRGSLSATYTMDDTVSQTALGRVISGPVYKDDKITTNAQAQARASALLGALGTARETITLTSHRAPSDAYTLFVGARKIKFTRATDGLSSQPYPNTRVGLSFPNGTAKWTFELGATLLTQGQDPITGISAGARFVGDTVAPGVPSWPTGTTWILGNTYDINTGTTTVQVQWNAPTTGLGDLKSYLVKYRRSDRNYDNYSPTIPKATTSWELRDLPPNITVNFYVEAIDTSNNHSGFTTTTQQLVTAGGSHIYSRLVNGDFEGLDPTDPTKAAYWQRTAVGTASFAITTDANTGLYAYALTSTSMANTATIKSLYAAALAGHNYRFQFSHKWDAAIQLDVLVYWYDASLSLISTSTLISGGGGAVSTYRRDTYFAVAPATTVAYKLEFMNGSFGGPTVVYKIDTITVTDVIDNPMRVRSAYSADTSLGITDDRVAVDASGGSKTMTLPDATLLENLGREFTIKKTDSSTNSVTIATTSSQTIDGITTYPLVERNQSVTVLCTGSSWEVVAQSGLFLESDGTRWLGPRLSMPLIQSVNSGGTEATYTATTLIGRYGPFSPHTYWIDDVVWSYYVATTNSGSHYWTLRWGIESTSLGGSVECDINTSAVAADTRVTKEGTSFTHNPFDFSSSPVFDMFVEVRKDTGSPGTLHLYGVNLLARRVYG